MTDNPTTRLFPILWGYNLESRIRELRGAGQSVLPIGLPWNMLAAHERQAQKNHGQSLVRLADRGGLSPCEALAVLDDRDWREMPLAESVSELCRRVTAWQQRESNDDR